MKNVLILFVILGCFSAFFSGCESRTGFQEIEWSKKSGKPLPAELKKINLKTDIQNQTRFEKIEFQSQQVQGIPLENAFVKKIYSQTGELISLSGVVDNRAAANKADIENMKQQQSEVISRLRSRYPELAKVNDKIITFEQPELIFEKKGK
ncbi:MAG TPA: hypothetical protein VIG33_08245, partial [Pseudobdellovibrionaceae bacterium]